MNVGDQAALYSHNGFRRFVTIAEVELLDGFSGKLCYKTTEGSVFYMEDLPIGTGKFYNVGNKSFWIKASQVKN